MTATYKKRDKKKNKKFDVTLESTDERKKFIEEKLGYISKLPSYVLMGYSTKNRRDDKKFDRIPKLIENYTTYFLRANDVDSSKKTEYSYYVDEHDEMIRQKNKVLYRNAEPFDDVSSNNTLSHSETYIDNRRSDYMDNSHRETLNSQVLKYAFKTNSMEIKDYKKLLSMGVDVMLGTKDKELIEIVEQVIFNCSMTAKDDVDRMILKNFVQGIPLREISEKVGVGKTTVDRRIDKMIGWVGQNQS